MLKMTSSFSASDLAEQLASNTQDAEGLAEVLVAIGALSKHGDRYSIEGGEEAIQQSLSFLSQMGARA